MYLHSRTQLILSSITRVWFLIMSRTIHAFGTRNGDQIIRYRKPRPKEGPRVTGGWNHEKKPKQKPAPEPEPEPTQIYPVFAAWGWKPEELKSTTNESATASEPDVHDEPAATSIRDTSACRPYHQFLAPSSVASSHGDLLQAKIASDYSQSPQVKRGWRLVEFRDCALELVLRNSLVSTVFGCTKANVLTMSSATRSRNSPSFFILCSSENSKEEIKIATRIIVLPSISKPMIGSLLLGVFKDFEYLCIMIDDICPFAMYPIVRKGKFKRNWDISLGFVPPILVLYYSPLNQES